MSISADIGRSLKGTLLPLALWERKPTGHPWIKSVAPGHDSHCLISHWHSFCTLRLFSFLLYVRGTQRPKVSGLGSRPTKATFPRYCAKWCHVHEMFHCSVMSWNGAIPRGKITWPGWCHASRGCPAEHTHKAGGLAVAPGVEYSSESETKPSIVVPDQGPSQTRPYGHVEAYNVLSRRDEQHNSFCSSTSYAGPDVGWAHRAFTRIPHHCYTHGGMCCVLHMFVSAIVMWRMLVFAARMIEAVDAL